MGVDREIVREGMHLDRGRLDQRRRVHELDPKQINDHEVHEKTH